jgi:hypothetical protein
MCSSNTNWPTSMTLCGKNRTLKPIPESYFISAYLCQYQNWVALTFQGERYYSHSMQRHHRHRCRRRLSRSRPVGMYRFRIYFLKLMNLFGQLVGLLGRGIGPTQGLYLHSTTQYRKAQTHIHASIGNRTTIPVFERPKTVRASDRSVQCRVWNYI